MNHPTHRGQLISWNDERGFGFIRPDAVGASQIFVHISAFNHAARRPMIGDIIFYTAVADEKGKQRATTAVIEGVQTHHRGITTHARRKRSGSTLVMGVLGMVFVVMVLGAIFVYADYTSPKKVVPPLFIMVTKPGCVIKGNISVNTGNKYYHLPEMQDYAITVIDMQKGERWFCTEREAIDQGWQKAPQ